ncbi:MAG: hypothetical protein R8J94_21840 [Acidimicrobiia bacterium]|nr:hypothetical protein [Acidimicrobiia bacterium]
MNTPRFVHAAGLAIAIALLATGCSSPEDDLRSDLLAEGMSETSADCIITSFEDAGIDLDDVEGMSPSSDIPADAELAMAGCLEEIFNEMFSEGFAELEADMAEAFEDFDSDGAIAFNDSVDADLGALVTSCEGGDNAACDDLWLASPIDSVEEQIAENCGGRAQERRMGTCEFWDE